MGNFRLLFSGIYAGLGAFGKIISSMVNFLLLLIVFIFGVGLVALFSRFLGKKFLDMKPKAENESYWRDSIIKNRKKEDYYKPF